MRRTESQQQVGDVAVAGNVAAVRERVLRDEDRLLNPAGRQPLDLFHDVGARPAPVTAAELGNGAEGAAHVAPFRDLHVRVGNAGHQKARRGCVVEITRRSRGSPVLSAGRLSHQLDDAREVRGAQDAVDLGHLLQNVAAVALSETAGDDEGAAGSPLLQLRELQDRLDRFLARAVDERAGVDDEALGVLGALREREPGLGQHAEHQLGVDLVLRTAEGRQMHLHGREPVYLAQRAKSPSIERPTGRVTRACAERRGLPVRPPDVRAYPSRTGPSRRKLIAHASEWRRSHPSGSRQFRSHPSFQMRTVRGHSNEYLS